MNLKNKITSTYQKAADEIPSDFKDWFPDFIEALNTGEIRSAEK